MDSSPPARTLTALFASADSTSDHRPARRRAHAAPAPSATARPRGLKALLGPAEPKRKPPRHPPGSWSQIRDSAASRALHYLHDTSPLEAQRLGRAILTLQAELDACRQDGGGNHA